MQDVRENSIAPPSPGLATAVATAAARIQRFQRRSTQLFSVSVDILNAARNLDSMSVDLQLLARNGVVRAAHLNHATGGKGNTLLALAKVLSECPQELAPQVAQLVQHCRAIARHTADCTSLARRYQQHFRALVDGLRAGAAMGEEREFANRLADADLLTESGFSLCIDRRHLAVLHGVGPANLLLIAERCAEILRRLRSEFSEVRASLVAVGAALKAVQRAVGTVNYLGMNVAIEAAHFSGAGADFQRLAGEIEAAMARFAEQVQTIGKSAGAGGALLQELGA